MGNRKRIRGRGATARRTAAGVVVATVAVLLLAGGCTPGPTPQPPSVAEVVAAGDIASCRTEADEATAKLVEGVDGTVLALGDEAYPEGSLANFEECYGPSWGRFKDRTRPVPGNHEYYTEGARGYFEYFGEAAGDPEEGYYSYDAGSWHVVALNSNCEEVRCGPGSPQTKWLEEDLAAAQARCTLAYMHHPRFSSGEKHGSTSGGVEVLWETLYEANTDVVLSGHEHNYERFAPQDPRGRADPERGIRQFVVGTGGGGGEAPISSDPIANSEVRTDGIDGVLELTLRPQGYEWKFVTVGDESFTDSGDGQCH